jgi:hypothetical protein
MASPFEIAAAATSAAVDRVYGKSFFYQPMTAATDVNARPVFDPTRAAVTITAAFSDAFFRAGEGPTRSPGVNNEKPGHASSRPQISFDAAALPYRAQRGDRITRLADGKIFRVAEVHLDDTRRILCDLNETV